MPDLPKTQTEKCKACGIVHSPRHWTEEAAHTPNSASSETQKHQTEPAPKKHELWHDKAGEFITHFSRTKTEPVAAEHVHDEREPEKLHRRSSSFSRRNSGFHMIDLLDFRDGVIDFRDEDGSYDPESDHVATKKNHWPSKHLGGRAKVQE